MTLTYELHLTYIMTRRIRLPDMTVGQRSNFISFKIIVWTHRHTHRAHRSLYQATTVIDSKTMALEIQTNVFIPMIPFWGQGL